LPWTDDSGPVPNRSEDELLALVRQKAEAVGGRRRRRAGLTTAAVLLVGLLATVTARSGPGPETELRTVAGLPPTSTSTPGPAPTVTTLLTTDEAMTTTTMGSRVTTTHPSSVRPPAPVPTTVATASPAPPPTTAPAPTTSTSLVCRNSTDPACGPFRWDPPPGPNQPMTLAVSVSPAAPKARETVTFRVTVDDPDGAYLVSEQGSLDYGDGTPVPGYDGHVDCFGSYGPWTPPDPAPLHKEITYQHAYAGAGTYTVTFTFKSLGNCAYGPSEAIKTATVSVTAAG
jgi:hypothetical protein